MRHPKPTGISEHISRLRNLEGWNNKRLRADREPVGIDTEREYHLVLFDLGLLDDDDNWDMYLQQEARYEHDTSAPGSPEYWEDIALYWKYVGVRCAPRPATQLKIRPRSSDIPYVYELRVKSDR
jgi:hypothetical protein